jgi:tryptophanyl-tRNA synthetase
MYKANGVPVGEDQGPHVEMTREIARRFNHLYKKVFPVPDLLLTPTSKLLGIDRRKMSKSYNNAIFLSDPTDEVAKKVARMITDPQRARRTDPGNPDVCNVFSFHEIYTPRDVVKQIDGDCRTAALGCVDCKKILAENLNKALDPIREKRKELEANLDKVKEIMDQGNTKARSIAQETMIEVREAVKL